MRGIGRESQNKWLWVGVAATKEKKVDSCYRIFWNWRHQGAQWGERHRRTYSQCLRSLEAAATLQRLPPTLQPNPGPCPAPVRAEEGRLCFGAAEPDSPQTPTWWSGRDTCQNAGRQAHLPQVDKQKLPDQSRFQVVTYQSIIY